MKADAALSPAFRAVVFDFDGVIVESADVKTDAFLELFRDLPHLQSAIRQHHLENLGVSRFKKFEWIYKNLLNQALPPEESRRLGDRFSSLVFRRVVEAPFVPGALESLQGLSPVLPLFVASGTPQEELRAIIEARGLSAFFREVWGTPREKPDILEDIMKRFALDPHDVLFIGDGMSDHRAALATGVCFLAREIRGLQGYWVTAKVPRVRDLTALPTRVLGSSH